MSAAATSNGHSRVGDPLIEWAPPEDRDAEFKVLACILCAFIGEDEGLLDNGAGASTLSRALAVLGDGAAFNVEKHRIVFDAIRRTVAAGHPAVPAILRPVLRDIAGVNDGTAAVEVVDECAEARVSRAQVEYYAGIVRKKAAERALRVAAIEVLQAAKEGHAPDGGDAGAWCLARISKAAEVRAGTATLTGKTPAEILDNPDAERAWLVEGLVPRGCLVALCSPPKEGKSSLLARKIGALSRGGSVIGLDCPETVTTVWVTEESETTIRALLAAAGLRDARLVIVTRAECGGMSWSAIVAGALALARKHDAALLVFDTFAGLAGLTGEEENQAGPVLAALRPLRAATAEGRSVVVTHHLNKDPGKAGVNALRGSSAFAGEVDGFLLLRKEGGEDSNVRVLSGAGRGDGWVRGVRYELDPDGSLRRLHGRGQAVAAAKRDDIVAAVQANPAGLSQSAVHGVVGGRREDVYAALAACAADGTLLCTPGARGAKVYRSPVPAEMGQVGTGRAGQGGAPVPTGAPFRGPGDRSPSPTPSRVPDSAGVVGTGGGATTNPSDAEIIAAARANPGTSLPGLARFVAVPVSRVEALLSSGRLRMEEANGTQRLFAAEAGDRP